MIFVRDKGQMCNNMLQYGHLYAWGREHGRHTVSMRFSYKYQYFKLCHSKYHHFLTYLAGKWGAALHLLHIVDFGPGHDAKACEQMLLKHHNIVAQGWYVSFPDLFLKYRDEITDMFTIEPQFSDPVKAQMQEAADDIKLGVHIRRGDYATWYDGKFFYDDSVYAAYINRFAELLPAGQKVSVFLSTNDPQVNQEWYQQHCPKVTIHHLKGNPAQDLYMLSACDYLIGPPSTFSCVAAMYRDLPLYRMDNDKAEEMMLEGFRKFDYWFRHIL